ncbi:gamma-glutamyltransferase family protein, partial [Catenulispora pinisilvae]|uniref:gamma-glutamyltransferase family protein n=1 Tax=Catenulispora pinisilvae TaxID=2705253 RepID=UPI00189252F4
MTAVQAFTTRPELSGTFGMVSSTHWLASSAGMAVLERGGNAFDAAVAAGFVLHVVEPHQNGAGGDLPVIFARGDDKRPTVLCGQGVAPAGATVRHYRDLGLELVPGSGLLAAAVPGAVPAWLTLLRDHGTMELADVLGYAIGYARDGYPVTPAISQCIADIEPMFREHWTTSADVYLPDGKVPAAGSVFGNPTLATTYQRLADSAGVTREARIDAALNAWSQGFLASAVDTFARTAWRDSSGSDHAGVITGADMAAWQPSYEEPVRYDFGGHTFCKTGPWGQGPVLLQQLALLQDPEPMSDLVPGSVDFVHRVVEGAKLAFADREAWYGDGFDTPLDALLSPEYNAARRGLIGEVASLELRPGSPGGRAPVLPQRPELPIPADASTGEPVASAASGEARGDTVHVDVVDRWGNMVAAMPSGGWLHSSPVIPALGFCLGTRLQMTWLQDGLASTLTPGSRPRTTLSPTLALRADDGEPLLAFGSPGGDQQDQWQLLFVLNHVVGGMNLQEAIDAPTFHTSHFPESFYPRPAYPGRLVAEARLGAAVLDSLRRRGHEVVVSGDWSLGRMCAVGRDPERGLVRAAANPRGMQGYA